MFSLSNQIYIHIYIYILIYEYNFFSSSSFGRLLQCLFTHNRRPAQRNTSDVVCSHHNADRTTNLFFARATACVFGLQSKLLAQSGAKLAFIAIKVTHIFARPFKYVVVLRAGLTLVVRKLIRITFLSVFYRYIFFYIAIFYSIHKIILIFSSRRLTIPD